MKLHNHYIRVFRPEDLSTLVLPGWVRSAAWESYVNHPSFSAYCQSEWIGSAGFMVPYPGMAEAWAILSPGVRSPAHTAFFFRKARGVMLQLVGDLSIRRLQATVMADQLPSRRLVERLGFSPEALLHKFGPNGEDAFIYARFFNG